ncbi:MAG: hypothetical protein OXD36_16065 [Rhodobacter sp.]|nr:hypothetical protein [Rhodobacter sp.]
MSGEFRKLNGTGIAAFRDYVREGAEGPPPVRLLESPETSEPLRSAIQPGSGRFDDRYMFGIYLNTLLKGFDPAAASGDVGLWSALALHWFDRLCPPDAGGNRSPGQEYLYVLSSDYRHYYRHLVRSPWQLVKDHGEASRFLLVSPRERKHPLSVNGEILEQFGGRQQVLGSRSVIRAASKLYLDARTSRPRTGVAGSGRGSARRFGLVLRQLDLTYDPECMSDSALINILPDEFDRWRKLMAAGR